MTNKEKLHFTEDRIIIFKGNTYPFKDWFKENGAKYHPLFGWYFSTYPDVYPNELVPEELYWESIVLADGDTLKPRDEIQKIVDEIRFDPSSSEFVGKIGESITINVFVDTVKEYTTQFGNCAYHRMHDEKGNEFVWTATSKMLKANQSYTLKARIKEHRTFRNTKQTVIYYCQEV